MAQYQSFPGAAGDSRSLDKLKLLHLPAMAGKRFLDVGCNEGFFCGYAAYLGALRSVGLDQSALFIERARAHFPRCEFIQSGWDTLPDGPFDVILLASALHYADDQPALVHSLVSRLAPDGVLVLELGIASSQKSEWMRVKRGIDERYFPSMPKVREMLEPYAWKWMGPSIAQDGDPVNRHVLHISRPRPLAYLLMMPPAHGKTSIARSLFGKSGIPVVSGDEVIASIAERRQAAIPELLATVADGYSPFRLDAAVQRVFDVGLGGELVKACMQAAGGGDFGLDMYVPQARHALVEQLLVDAGYLPVVMRWDRPGAALPPRAEVDQQADAYYLSLAQPRADTTEVPVDAPWRQAGCGFVDELAYADGKLVLRGWAVDKDGDMPGQISVRLADKTMLVDNFERQIRQDVQSHLGLRHALLGYRIVLDLPGLKLRSLARGLRLQIPGGAVFEVSAPIDTMLAGAD